MRNKKEYTVEELEAFLRDAAADISIESFLAYYNIKPGKCKVLKNQILKLAKTYYIYATDVDLLKDLHSKLPNTGVYFLVDRQTANRFVKTKVIKPRKKDKEAIKAIIKILKDKKITPGNTWVPVEIVLPELRYIKVSQRKKIAILTAIFESRNVKNAIYIKLYEKTQEKITSCTESKQESEN